MCALVSMVLVGAFLRWLLVTCICLSFTRVTFMNFPLDVFPFRQYKTGPVRVCYLSSPFVEHMLLTKMVPSRTGKTVVSLLSMAKARLVGFSVSMSLF